MSDRSLPIRQYGCVGWMDLSQPLTAYPACEMGANFGEIIDVQMGENLQASQCSIIDITIRLCSTDWSE